MEFHPSNMAHPGINSQNGQRQSLVCARCAVLERLQPPSHGPHHRHVEGEASALARVFAWSQICSISKVYSLFDLQIASFAPTEFVASHAAIVRFTC
jgi:hypothetical protein